MPPTKAFLAAMLVLLAGCASQQAPGAESSRATSPSPLLPPEPFPESHSRFYKTPIELTLNQSFVQQHGLYGGSLQLQPNVSVVATYDLHLNLNQSVHLRLNWTAFDWGHSPPNVEGVEFTPPQHEWDLSPGWANLTVQVTIRETYSHHGQGVTITPNMETTPFKFPKRQEGFLATLL